MKQPQETERPLISGFSQRQRGHRDHKATRPGPTNFLVPKTEHSFHDTSMSQQIQATPILTSAEQSSHATSVAQNNVEEIPEKNPTA